MPGRAIIAPVSFGDTTLPKIDITYVAPLAGALYDFAVDQLPLGPVASWASLVDGVPIVADGSTTPTVMTDGATKMVRFNGTIDRMKVTTNLATARTIVAVARLRAPVALDQIFYGASTSNEGAIGVPSGATNYAGYGGGSTLSLSPAVVPDANWHVFILTHAGTSSAVRVDNTETTGNLPLATQATLTLGFGPAADFRSEIDYKRVAILAGGTTTAQRGAIVAQLKAQYGI